MEAQKDVLCALDAAIGDGDQGVTMAIGFRAIRKSLEGPQGHELGSIITRSAARPSSATRRCWMR